MRAIERHTRNYRHAIGKQQHSAENDVADEFLLFPGATSAYGAITHHGKNAHFDKQNLDGTVQRCFGFGDVQKIVILSPKLNPEQRSRLQRASDNSVSYEDIRKTIESGENEDLAHISAEVRSTPGNYYCFESCDLWHAVSPSRYGGPRGFLVRRLFAVARGFALYNRRGCAQ